MTSRQLNLNAPAALEPLRPGALLHLLNQSPLMPPSGQSTAKVTRPLRLIPGGAMVLQKPHTPPKTSPRVAVPQQPLVLRRPAPSINTIVTAESPRASKISQSPPLVHQDMSGLSPPSSPPKTILKKRTPQPTTAETCAKTLNTLGLTKPELALLCAPSGFIDCTVALTQIDGLGDDDQAMLYLRKTGRIWGYDRQKNEIKAHPYASLYDAPWPSHWKHIHQARVELVDEDGSLVYVTFFGPASLRSKDPHGMMLLHGTIKSYGNKLFIQRPEQIPAEAFGCVYPRYTTPGNTTNEAGVRAIVTQALNLPDSIHACVTELVRKTLLSEDQLVQIAQVVAQKNDLCDGRDEPIRPVNVAQIFEWMHEPPTLKHGQVAVACARAIAVEGICHVARRTNERPPHPKCALSLTPQIIKRVMDSQPEKLTNDQQVAIRDICSALQRPTPLTGLLTGDVGTGKTLTFAMPAIAAHLAGAKVCLLAPTEILANQAFAGLVRRFPFARIERVVTGKKIQDPSAVLIGTAGLCTVAKKADYHPELLIVDEQHKLSTEIRSALCQPWTHIIEASATPIPRSLASSLFAGMDVFNLTKAPVQRSISSHLYGEDQRNLVVKKLKQVIDEGGRAAFIYPRVNTSSSAQNSVLQAAQTLASYFPGKVCSLHGKMKSEEIQASLDGFRSGETPIAVSSTVMETGIDIPDIRLLVVRDADNFGAAQLHQLRGRLARNGGSADFFMLVKDVFELQEDTLERLSMVKKTTDGYALAEEDMRQRGFGDLAGDAQSGTSISPIRLLNLRIEDFEEK